jgi:phage-related protein
VARENIDFTVDLHDALSAPAARAEAAVGSLGRSVDGASRDLGGFDRASLLAKRAMDVLRRAANATARAVDDVGDELRTTAALAVVARVAMVGLHKQAVSAGRGLGVLKLALAGLALSAVTTAVFLLVGAIGALGAGAYAAVAGLSPLAANLAALPALLTGLIGTIATVKLGFKGIGDAMKVLADPKSTVEEIQAALSGLSPAARDFVNVLMELRNQTQEWTKSIQAAMLPGFTAGLKAIGPILPVIGRGLTLMGGAVGRLAESLGALVGGWGRDFRLIFEQNTRLIDQGLSPALRAFLSIFKNLVIVGGPLAERFARWVAAAAQNLAAMVREGRRTGTLGAFLQRAGDLARATKNVLGDLFVALFNIGRESQVLGDAMGRSFRRTIREFREWTESVEGRNSIRAFFEDAIPAVRELGRFALALTGIFGSVGTNPGLAKLLRQIRKELLPALGELGNTFSAQIGPALIDLLTGLATALAQLPFSPLVEAARAAGDLAVAIGDLLKNNPKLATLVSTLLTAAFALKATAVVGKATGITSLVGQLLDADSATRQFVGGLRGVYSGAKEAGEEVSKAAEFGNAMSEAWIMTKLRAEAAMGGIKRMTAAIKASTVATKLQAAASKVGAAAARILGAAMSVAFGPVGIAIAIILVLVGLFVLLYKKNEAFRDIVNKVAGAVKDFAITAWEWIKRVGVAVGKWLVGAWQSLWPVIKQVAAVVAQVFGVVWKVVSTYLKLLWRFWSTVFAVIIGVVVLFVTKVFIPYVKMLFRFWSAVVRAVLAVWRTVFNAVAGVVMWLVTNVVIPYVKILYRFWSTIVRAILAVWRVVFRAIATVAKAVFRGIQTAVGVMRRVLSAVFRVIGAVGRAIWRPIRTVASAVFRGISAVAKVFGRAVGAVWNGIRSAARTVFGALMGIARPVFRALRSAFSGLGEFVGGIWDGVRSAFEAAIGGIKDALNAVIGTVNKALSAFNKLPGPNVDTIPTLFTGGATKAGMTALVGEHGPEVHVTRGGAATLIGAGGPELRRFTQPGYVVPNPVTPKTMIQPIPAWARAGADRFLGHGGTAERTLSAPPVAAAPSVGAVAAAAGPAGSAATGLLDVPQIHVHLHGDGSALTEADVERAAIRAYRRMQREQKERR